MSGWGQDLKPRVFYENPTFYWWSREQGVTDAEMLIEQAAMDRTDYNIMLKESVQEEMQSRGM